MLFDMCNHFESIDRIKQPDREDIKLYPICLWNHFNSLLASGKIISGVSCLFLNTDLLVEQDSRPTIGVLLVKQNENQILYVRGKEDSTHTNAYVLDITLIGTTVAMQSTPFSGGIVEIPSLFPVEHENPSVFNYLKTNFKW